MIFGGNVILTDTKNSVVELIKLIRYFTWYPQVLSTSLPLSRAVKPFIKLFYNLPILSKSAFENINRIGEKGLSHFQCLVAIRTNLEFRNLGKN